MFHVEPIWGIFTEIFQQYYDRAKGDEMIKLPVGFEPFYADEDAQIYIFCADSRKVMPAFEPDSFDLGFYDPPFGVGKAEWDSRFVKWFFKEAARLAPIALVTPGTNNTLRCPFKVGRLQYRWTLAAHILNGMTQGKIGFHNCIHGLLWAADGALPYVKEQDAKDFTITGKKKDHPSPKPEAVMLWFLRRALAHLLEVTPAHQLRVLDCFLGSGTTLTACKKLGLAGIGIEREREHCEEAVRELKQASLILAIERAREAQIDESIASSRLRLFEIAK